MLGLVFIGPNLRPRPAHVANVAVNHTDVLAVTTVASHSPSTEGDCNGDGIVNGEDIQCYMSHQAAGSQAAGLQPEVLARRLLGI